MPRVLTLPLLALALLTAACDQLGIESAGAVAARREAEGKAIGGACRHAARSIEQCYAANRKADKAAVFAGWREMNDYMRENKIDAMPSPGEAEVAAADKAADEGEATQEASAAKKSGAAGAAKGAGGEAPKAKAGKPAPAKSPA